MELLFIIVHYHVMKSRVIKLNVNRKVLPCLLVKMSCKFPATSCSDSISICDKDKNNDSRLTFYLLPQQEKLADSHTVVTLI